MQRAESPQATAAQLKVYHPDIATIDFDLTERVQPDLNFVTTAPVGSARSAYLDGWDSGSFNDKKGAVMSDNDASCCPVCMKFSGANHALKALRSWGHSPSTAANQAVSRFRPFTIDICRNTPS